MKAYEFCPPCTFTPCDMPFKPTDEKAFKAAGFIHLDEFGSANVTHILLDDGCWPALRVFGREDSDRMVVEIELWHDRWEYVFVNGSIDLIHVIRFFEPLIKKNQHQQVVEILERVLDYMDHPDDIRKQVNEAWRERALAYRKRHAAGSNGNSVKD